LTFLILKKKITISVSKIPFLRDNPIIMVRASIIIVNYNTFTHITDCLRSIEPVLADNDEVIVVDNCSTEEENQQIPLMFPWIKFINSDQNPGVGGGNNIGAKFAQGKYLVFINPDITVTEGWIDSLVTTLESYPGAGMVTPKILIMQEPNKINTCGLDIHVSGLSLCKGIYEDKVRFSSIEEVNAISGTAFIIKKEVFQHIGSFDEDVFLYMEDVDISMRGRLAGYTCLFDPNSIVYHKYALSFGAKKVFYEEYHRYLILLKCYRIITLFFMLPVMILTEIVTWGFVLLKDRKNWRNKIRAYALIIKNWRRVLDNHKKTQRIRKVKDRDLLLRHTVNLAYEQTGMGIISRISHIVFDSLYFLLTRIAYIFIWW